MLQLHAYNLYNVVHISYCNHVANKLITPIQGCMIATTLYT